LTQGFGIERCRIPALVYSCPKRGAIIIAAIIMLGEGNSDMPVASAL
jgi:hypothetical protein